MNNTNGFIVHRPPENVSIYHCVIDNITDHAIQTTPFNAFHVDAQECYWGDPGGPYHPTKNPSGGGGDIGDEIFFEPWYRDPEFTQLGSHGEDDPDPSYVTLIIMTFTFLTLAGLTIHLWSGTHFPKHGEASPLDSLSVVRWNDLPMGLTPAPIGERTAASIIDGLLLVVITVPPLLLVVDRMDQVPINFARVLGAYLLVPVVYFLLFDGFLGQTPGKRAFHLRIISLDEPAPSPGKVILPSIMKGFLFPFLNIGDAVVGIFNVHRGTRQRVSQHSSRIMVISDPPRPPGRQQRMSTLRSILDTHRAFQTARTELTEFIAGSPSITDLERELHDSETYLERTQFRQPDGEGPTRNDIDCLRDRINRTKNARSREAEIFHWMERLTTYRRQLESIDGSSPRVAPYLKRWTLLHQARTNIEYARAFLNNVGAISRESQPVPATVAPPP